MVLLAHCVWIFPENDGWLSQIMALFGFLGVEIFFVLSGFLIGRILYRQFTSADFNFSSIRLFLKRRWFRTLPNYFLILMVNLLIACFIGYPVEGAWRYFIFMQNFATPLLPFFPESWSLSVEEFAYVILPLVLFGFGAFPARSEKSKIFLTIVIMLIIAGFFAKVIYHISVQDMSLKHWNIALKSVVIYRVDAIFTGVLFSWIYSNYHDFWKRIRIIAAVAGFVMMGFFTAGIGYFRLLIETHPFFWNVIYLPAASFSIALFLPILTGWRTANGILKKPVTFISLISYSIYLLHYSVILQSLKQVVDTESLSDASRILFTAGYLCLTIFSSFLLFRYFEKPFTDLRDR
jgi:peptidoglycan/LPS O-acetylase OafA/YrhL